MRGVHIDRSIWTKARGATERLEKTVEWTTNDDDEYTLKTDATTLEPKHRRHTAPTIRAALRKRRDQELLSKPSHGKAMKYPNQNTQTTSSAMDHTLVLWTGASSIEHGWTSSQ